MQFLITATGLKAFNSGHKLYRKINNTIIPVERDKIKFVMDPESFVIGYWKDLTRLSKFPSI